MSYRSRSKRLSSAPSGVKCSLMGSGKWGRGRPINNVIQFQSYVSKNKMHLNFSANWIKFAFGGSATFSQIKS